jgi:hypothetical protein
MNFAADFQMFDFRPKGMLVEWYGSISRTIHAGHLKISPAGAALDFLTLKVSPVDFISANIFFILGI